MSDQQFGFRRKKGTQDAILKLQKHATETLDRELIPVAIMLDYSSAFDCIPHQRMIRKLERTGIADKALQLLPNYSKNRTQRLRCAGMLSDPEEIVCGVPQGGSPSAVLFTIYINDLLKSSNVRTTYLGYADGTSLLFAFDKEVDFKVLEAEMRRVMR